MHSNANQEISVKVGHKHLKFNRNDLSEAGLNCDRLVRQLLNKHNSKAKIAYSLFENKNGVERMIGANEKVGHLIGYWIDEQVELSIKRIKINDFKKFNKTLIQKFHKKNRKETTKPQNDAKSKGDVKKLDAVTNENQVEFLRYIYMKLKEENCRFAEQNNGDVSFNSYGSSNEHKIESHV